MCLYCWVRCRLWVISISVVLLLVLSVNSRLLICWLVVWFRLLVGLLVNRMCGCVMNVCVSVMCCCLLLESWCG